ncbi:flagellar export chaperone FliS [Thiolapillus brandeum]|uniref:Flagellar secretion chaperone FliS n=1 Tax=Thiolapillus brandeum TaxID=1076588 RepID=A0A7U6GIM5_9GAMM|nr:flagellar export chaperone FliS [Thiolapillus brandeum]BAO44300.1 flagellar protein FliS [Thiolapillus brandeum]
MSYLATPSAAEHYSQVDTYTGVTGADSHRLVLMLLNGALSNIAVARGTIEHGDVSAKGESISHAISIINGLRGSLNLKLGGELAENLDRLYDYMERRLLEVTLHGDVEILEEVSSLLHEIKEGWMAIPEEVRADPVKAASAERSDTNTQ